MNNNIGNQFGNPLFGIDTSRNGVNKVMNPSIRNYPSSAWKEAGPDASGRTGGAGSNSPSPSAITETPEKTAIGKSAAEKSIPDNAGNAAGFRLEFTANGMLNGIILSELLGKPKFLQKRRW